MPNTVNRLIEEKSPYLLQHAHNPVNWYPWGKEAFEKAEEEDKPIFLSIGYSTCHWCHVMERESFEDEKVAQILNENFISIKVDREERPDIDSIYMSACQAMTGQGGWPLTVFLDHDKKPFYAGTYFPKESKMRMPGLIQLLERISDLWINDREELTSISKDVTEAIESHFYKNTSGEVSKSTLDKGYQNLEDNFDFKFGGFGKAPKFPTPHNLFFLLRYYNLTEKKNALYMVEKTLRAMYSGGIYDHIGYGFSRYSTDQKWLVPHFEKMLYDNALLAIAYLEAFELTRDSFYSNVAEEIFTYVLRDMTSPEGVFYSAEDADSEGVEGKFYVFTPQEIRSILGKKKGEDFCKKFNITEQGNFNGKSIPNLINQSLSKSKFSQEIELIFNEREKRIRPFRDEKILTSWNGLMIVALAYAGRILKNQQYVNKAKDCVSFIVDNLVDTKGRLLSRYKDGEASIPGFLEDYAFLTWGIIELYQATYHPDYLETALDITKEMYQLFWDKDEGGFFMYGHDSEELISRPKELYDGAYPSGNSVVANNILRLYRLTADEELERLIEKIFKTFGGTINESPISYSHFLSAIYLKESPKTQEITLVTDKLEDRLTQEMLKILESGFNPDRYVIVKSNDLNSRALESISPIVKNRDMVKNKPTAYVCQNFTCFSPVNDSNKLKRILDQ
ncbi:thioredoxin domain-containing protein [Natranaerobius trueperi]|uniref:Thioredoxin domain-containing protein n=1 Tax=Natranaerobius trueperi TaxID=759412 RepID=A0A226BX24_9FIRM|nr:thioredoxin domain-containing protein [Natranaerobius trueperi]OWZ82680.1 thioredoxin domain-containing protein [Natranaerobius trueperi]